MVIFHDCVGLYFRIANSYPQAPCIEERCTKALDIILPLEQTIVAPAMGALGSAGILDPGCPGALGTSNVQSWGLVGDQESEESARMIVGYVLSLLCLTWN